MSSDTTVYTLYPEAPTDERGRYFDGQFLTAQDFVDEQRYHVDRLRRALDHLTVAGVADGLDVAAAGAWKLKLSPGVAIDGAGRLLSVLAARDGVDVPKDIPGGVVDVALVYAEIESRVHGGTRDEDGTRGASRMRELPALEFYAAGQPAPHPDGVPLARLHLANDGTVTIDVPNPVRRFTGLRLPSSGPSGPSLRAGFSRPELAALAGDLHITGKLGVGTPDPEAELDVRGLARVGALSVREQTFRVAGDEATFYPIAFRDNDWTAGQCTLEILRPSAQADAANAGSLMARLRWHAADGHGSDLLDLEIVQTRRFIALARPLKQDRLLVVWLRGNRSYAWRALSRVELVDAAATAKTLGGEKLDPRQTIDTSFDRDRVRLGPTLDREEIRGALTVTAGLVTTDIVYTGTLTKLDVAETTAATIRAYDFQLGHSTRRGSPGRALVDNKTSLVLNFAADWPLVSINSPLEVSGDTSLSGGTLRTTAAALTVGKPSSFTDKLTILRDDNHLQLQRPRTTTGGARVFLELYQDDATPATTPETFPAIRFHHNNRFYHRLEARSTGLHVRAGDPTSDDYRSLFVSNLNAAADVSAVNLKASADVSAASFTTAGNLKAGAITGTSLAVTGNLAGNDLTIAKGGTFRDQLRVYRDSDHLQLVRAKSDTGGAKLFLELYQEDSATPETYPAIRFHHSNRYYHRLEARSSGLHVRAGDTGSDDYKALYAGDLYANSLHATTGKAERLRIVRGTVSDAGLIAKGSGFTVIKDGSTLWKIIFSAPFDDVPTVVVTQQYPDNGDTSKAGNTKDNAIVVSVDKYAAWIKTGNNDGDQSWRRFHFIAIGT